MVDLRDLYVDAIAHAKDAVRLIVWRIGGDGDGASVTFKLHFDGIFPGRDDLGQARLSCFGRTPIVAQFLGEAFDLLEVPRRNWEDRVTLEVRPKGERRIVSKPFPFDVDPLPVMVPVRILDLPVDATTPFQSWWHAEPRQFISFEYCSA